LDRAALVDHARDSIARGSKSFALASKLFDPLTRERAWLLYAWCRKCDDLADGQDMGHGMSAVADAQERVAYIREQTDRALTGQPTDDPAFAAPAISALPSSSPIPRATCPRTFRWGAATCRSNGWRRWTSRQAST